MAVPSLPVIRHECLLHSLAGADPRLQLLSNGATWYPVPGSGTCTCTREQFLRGLISSVLNSKIFGNSLASYVPRLCNVEPGYRYEARNSLAEIRDNFSHLREGVPNN